MLLISLILLRCLLSLENINDILFISNKIKAKIEEALGLENSEKSLNSLLDEILDKTDKFYSPKHFKLMDVIEKSLIELHREQNGKKIIAEQEFGQLKETLTDFLYRLKDKHPSSIPEESKTKDKDVEEKKEAKGDKDAEVERREFDVFHRVMGFMRDNNLKPSKGLREKYAQSNTTKSLNEIPSFLDLNKVIHVYLEYYDEMKERYQSKPSFVYFFNSDQEIITKAKTFGLNLIQIGYFEKGTVRNRIAKLFV